MRKKVAGFTLIELLVAVVIISILSAIAYPMYQDQVRKSRRGIAKGALLELSQFMERNFTVANSYAQDSDGNAINTAWLPFDTSPADGTAYYDLTIVVVSGTYTLTATPVAGLQDADRCGTLDLDSVGNHTADAADCW